MKNFIKLLKSVLLCTLIVVCICGCGKGTAQYISSGETTSENEVQKNQQADADTGSNKDVNTEDMDSDSQGKMDSGIIGSDTMESDTEEAVLYVYVCGAIQNPGVYTLPEGSRICDLFEAAGGLTEEAAKDYWNQAKLITDGEMFYVPTMEEAEERQLSGLDVSSNGSDSGNTDSTGGKINLNTASLEELMQIPGIGESKARAIVDYREKNGGFSSVEEVMNIEGIKEGVFSKMKEYIVVN